MATAAEGIGAASAALDLAIVYAGEREQFGRPIGSFQALKHVIADAHVDREAAWSSVLYAAAALDEGLPDALEAAAIAKAYGARASRRVVEAALQVLGGIAFTWEHDVHLLQRRVLSCERRFGDALQHETALGAGLAERERRGGRMSTSTGVAPVLEGLFTTDPPALRGSRCTRLRHAALPLPRALPLVPEQRRRGRAALSTEGVVHTFTVVHAAPPGYRGRVAVRVRRGRAARGAARHHDAARPTTSRPSPSATPCAFETIVLEGGDAAASSSYAYRVAS